MYLIKLFLTATLLQIFHTSLFSQEKSEEIDSIKSIIQTAYVDGLQNSGDVEKIDKGFHPGFNLLGVGKNNQMWKYSIIEWKKDVAKKVASGELPRKGNKKVTINFLDVDVTGTAAVAKIEFYIGEKLTYMDFISLYKFGANWKIVSKIFYKL